MGTIGSQQSYSFAHQFQILPNSNPILNLFHLKHRKNQQLFLGKQLTSNDEEETYQIECIIQDKTINPSPFVTRLVRSQSYFEDGYCSTLNRFYLLYKSPPRRLSDQIKSRAVENRPFSLREIDNVINRICKGIKYLYDIYHNHCSISASSISWPSNSSEQVELIDAWVLPLQHNGQKQKTIYRPKDDEKINEKNLEKSNDLFNLGLVAKQMIQVSKGQTMFAHQAGYRQVIQKIQVLTAQAPESRFAIYNMQNSVIFQKVRNFHKTHNVGPTQTFHQEEIKGYTAFNPHPKAIQNLKTVKIDHKVPLPFNSHEQINKLGSNQSIKLIKKVQKQPYAYHIPYFPFVQPKFNIVGTEGQQKNVNTVSTGSQNHSLSNSAQKNKYIGHNHLQLKQEPKEILNGGSLHNLVIVNAKTPKMKSPAEIKVLIPPLRTKIEQKNHKKIQITESLTKSEQNLFTSPEFFQKIKNNIGNPVIHHSIPAQLKSSQNFETPHENQVKKSIDHDLKNSLEHPESKQKESLKTLIHENVLNINIPITESVDLSVNEHPDLNNGTYYQNNFQVEAQLQPIDQETPVKIQKINQPFSTIQEVSERSGSPKSDDEKQFVIQQYENGSRYEGYKKYGMRNGKGKFYYQEGSYYDGQWKNNNMHGNGKLYYSNNKIAYEGQWYMDQFHGRGKVYNDDPSSMFGFYDYTNFENVQQNWKYYEGDLVADSKQGIGKLVLSNDEYYEGQFKNDKVDGSGRFVTKNGQVIKGIWRQSRLVVKL